MILFVLLSAILPLAVSAVSIFACWLVFTVTETDKSANEEALREYGEPRE